MFKDNQAEVTVHVNLPSDQSSFAERLAARRKLRTVGEDQQLH